VLPPAERDIAARDGALPGLGLLLDSGRLAGCLGLDAIERPYLRYKPGTKCVLAFGSGEGARMAIACPFGRYAVLRKRKALREAGEAVRFFDDLCVAVLPASLDRDLRALARLADREQRQQMLRRLLGPDAAGATLRLLRHNPNRRAVLRVEGPGGPLALAKVHAEDEWPRTHDNARLAEARGGARVLGVAEDRRLIFYDWIAGRPLWSDGAGLAGAAAVEATGAALARLHRADPGNIRRITPAEEAGELAAAVRALAGLLPDLGERAEALTRTVAARLTDHGRTTTLLHGDFSADQVVIAPSGPVLIDWDRAGAGDPARDLGSFLARLDVQAMDGDLSVAKVDAAGRALLSGYAAQAPLPPGLTMQHARALLALLPEGFRQRRPDWPERAAAILDRAEALLPAPALPGDRLGELLARARDPDVAAPLVTAAAALPVGAVEGVTLLRLKPGRRALLRYALPEGSEPPALLGKLRAKGADTRTAHLHATLRAAGLDGRAPHRVGVPRPRGAIEGLHLWLQEEAPGCRLTGHLRPDGETAAAAQAGAALARLHATAAETTRRWTLADEIAVLQQALEQAAAQHLFARQRLDALLAGCRRAAAALPPVPEAGIHRDWYPDQILIDGGTAWILDLDLYARGDPAVDLGNFLAHVIELSIRRHGTREALAAHEAAFLDGYAGADGQFDATRVAVLKTLSLARLVTVSLRMPDRRPAAKDILQAAETEISAFGPNLKSQHDDSVSDSLSLAGNVDGIMLVPRSDQVRNTGAGG